MEELSSSVALGLILLFNSWFLGAFCLRYAVLLDLTLLVMLGFTLLVMVGFTLLVMVGFTLLVTVGFTLLVTVGALVPIPFVVGAGVVRFNGFMGLRAGTGCAVVVVAALEASKRCRNLLTLLPGVVWTCISRPMEIRRSRLTEEVVVTREAVVAAISISPFLLDMQASL